MTVFCKCSPYCSLIGSLVLLLTGLACAPALAEDVADAPPEESLTERQISKLADDYIQAVEDRNFEAWRELLSPLHPRARELNQNYFLEQTQPVESLSIEKIDGRNVTLQIRYPSRRLQTGSLQIDPAGRIKYTPLCFKHPLYAAYAPLEMLLRDEVTMLGATSSAASRAEALYTLGSLRIPLFDYKPLSRSRQDRINSARKILDWLEENGRQYDKTGPKLFLPSDEFDALIDRLRRVAR